MMALNGPMQWPDSITKNEKKKRDNPVVFEHLYRRKETLRQALTFPA
jgi:hypothetical protein